MKFLDKLALNRLIAIITSFILSVIKLLKSKSNPSDIDNIIPNDGKKRIPIFKKRQKSK